MQGTTGDWFYQLAWRLGKDKLLREVEQAWERLR